MSPRPSGGYDRPDLWRQKDIKRLANDPNAEAIIENVFAQMSPAQRKAFFRYLQVDGLKPTKQKRRKNG